MKVYCYRKLLGWAFLVLVVASVWLTGAPYFAAAQDATDCERDLARAQELLAQAQAALVNGDPATARDTVREAAAILERCVPSEATTAEEETASSDSSATPIPLPTSVSNNAELRAQQTDRDILLSIRLNGTCFAADTEIPAQIIVESFKPTAFYFYTRGALLFSINNSPLLLNVPAPEPLATDEFLLLALSDTYTFELEDVGLFLRGIDPTQLAFDFGATVFGLPAGDYWLTAGYTNPHDGLEPQRDGTFLIPQAAWRGTLVTREVRFRVVNTLADCAPSAEATPAAQLTPTITPTLEPVVCRVRNSDFSQVGIFETPGANTAQLAVLLLNQEADVVEQRALADGQTWLRISTIVLGTRFSGWVRADLVREMAGMECPEP